MDLFRETWFPSRERAGGERRPLPRDVIRVVWRLYRASAKAEPSAARIAPATANTRSGETPLPPPPSDRLCVLVFAGAARATSLRATNARLMSLSALE